MSKVIATNRKAHRDYVIFETVECGIALQGSEVKSLRAGKINLDDSFARVEGNGVTLYNTHISHYAEASYLNAEPVRTRKLLLHRNQIRKIAVQLAQRGFTLVPLKAYFNERGFAKLELGLCKGRKIYDKRDNVKRREADLAVRRMLKNRRK